MFARSPTQFLRPIGEAAFVFGPQISLQAFPHLLNTHLLDNPDTLEIENDGREMIARDFRFTDVERFVKRVCAWGGYAGVAGRVLKPENNDRTRLTTALRDAWLELQVSSPSIGRALRHVNTVRGLGTPSFASKHLRFLAPEQCPVFDSVLQARLPYSFTARGYEAFANDCAWLAHRLNAAHLACPAKRQKAQWLAADVEAALYTHALKMRDEL